MYGNKVKKWRPSFIILSNYAKKQLSFHIQILGKMLPSNHNITKDNNGTFNIITSNKIPVLSSFIIWSGINVSYVSFAIKTIYFR